MAPLRPRRMQTFPKAEVRRDAIGLTWDELGRNDTYCRINPSKAARLGDHLGSAAIHRTYTEHTGGIDLLPRVQATPNSLRLPLGIPPPREKEGRGRTRFGICREVRTRRPVSRVLCRPASEGAGRGGHSSGPPIAGRFSRPTRTARAGEALPPCGGASSLFGLAPSGACHAASIAGDAVRSYRTLSPLPNCAFGFEGQALRSFSGAGRSAFCGAIPGVAPGGRYPPPFRRGARTFLPPPCGEERPPGRLVRAKGERPGPSGQGRPIGVAPQPGVGDLVPIAPAPEAVVP